MIAADTIAALASAPGGAVAVLRLSGPEAMAVANRVWRGAAPLSPEQPRTLLFGRCRTSDSPDDPGDPALAVLMPRPASYTGEDVVEIHCHGGALVSRRVLAGLLRAGARAAEPGEFTRRAFLNGKLDLTQAEAVADIIQARSDAALRLAERQNAGVLGRRIRELRGRLIGVLAECESRLDFPEEELDWQPPATLRQRVAAAEDEISGLLASARDGMIFREGVRIVIAGPPNAGKSTLLNRLLGFDRAIVADTPGTTRDTVEEHASVRGIPVRLVDTAGIRSATDPIEGLGVERSFASLRTAQIVLWLLDATADEPAAELATLAEHRPAQAAAIAVWNKCDRHAHPPALPDAAPLTTVHISARTGTGIDALLDAIAQAVWDGPPHEEPEIAVGARHARLLEQAAEALPAARAELAAERWELAAIPLRDALNALGTITGETASPDVLDEIFRTFCIGK
jgi:tRNA modification GTPase